MKNEHFGEKVNVINAENMTTSNFKYKVNWWWILRRAPIIFIGLSLIVNIVVLIKNLVMVIG